MSKTDQNRPFTEFVFPGFGGIYVPDSVTHSEAAVFTVPGNHLPRTQEAEQTYRSDLASAEMTNMRQRRDYKEEREPRTFTW